MECWISLFPHSFIVVTVFGGFVNECKYKSLSFPELGICLGFLDFLLASLMFQDVIMQRMYS